MILWLVLDLKLATLGRKREERDRGAGAYQCKFLLSFLFLGQCEVDIEPSDDITCEQVWAELDQAQLSLVYLVLNRLVFYWFTTYMLVRR